MFDSIYVLIYVDDIVVTGSNSSLITDFITALRLFFPVKDLATLHYFLGIGVCHHSNGLFMSQACCIFYLLIRTNMHNSRPMSTPMSAFVKLIALDGSSLEDPQHCNQLYCSVVGSLQSLAFTKCDISFAINKINQFMHGHRLFHWQAVKALALDYPNASHVQIFD